MNSFIEQKFELLTTKFVIVLEYTYIYESILLCFFLIIVKQNNPSNIFAGLIFQEQDIFLLISSSVNLLCFNISGSVSEKNIINERSCLMSSNKFEKYASIYFFKNFSKIDFS